jgi:chemotaxis protein methyltransferase CheR
MIDITDEEFYELVGFIKNNYGINIKEEKRVLLMGRLSSTLAQGGYENFSEFSEALIIKKSSKAVTDLVNNITTNHTFFMREKDHFSYFKNTVLPYLERSVPDRDLRIWCAACSSGEESYTLAMIIDEYFGKKKLFWNSKILATDISERVLNEAKNGVYSNEKLQTIPSLWSMNYFRKYDDKNSIVIDALKNDVLYRRFNLMEKNFPFKKKFQVIFCRNVLIYFDNNTKIELVRKFYDCLEDGGYLFIGHSEAIAKNESDFKYDHFIES